MKVFTLIALQASGGDSVEQASRPLAPAVRLQVAQSGVYQVGNLKLRIEVPGNWKTVVETGGLTKISFYSPDLKSVLTVRIQPDRFESGMLLGEKARKLVQRYASAKAGMESGWNLGKLSGRWVDFQRQGQLSVAPTKARLAVVKLPEGLLEVLFTAASVDFLAELPACETFLSSLRVLDVPDPKPPGELVAMSR